MNEKKKKANEGGDSEGGAEMSIREREKGSGGGNAKEKKEGEAHGWEI